MNNFNYDLDQVERQILSTLGQTGLPIGVIYLLLNKITQDVQRTYSAQVQLEGQAVQAAAAQQQEGPAPEETPVEGAGAEAPEVEVLD
jgi:hypothetical protein